MLAAVLEDFGRLVLKDLPEPTPGEGEVVVRIRSCGFFVTDYKAIQGVRRNVAFPFIPGHEPAGVVAAVGRGASAGAWDSAVALAAGGRIPLGRLISHRLPAAEFARGIDLARNDRSTLKVLLDWREEPA